MDKATNLAVAPDDPPSIEERLAAGSADDVEQALRQIHDECPLPAKLADAILLAADLCAAVREFRADAKAGSCAATHRAASRQECRA
jgi:hypothetical protein